MITHAFCPECGSTNIVYIDEPEMIGWSCCDCDWEDVIDDESLLGPAPEEFDGDNGEFDPIDEGGD